MGLVLENNYCTVDDVFVECNLSGTVDPLLQSRIISAINHVSREIDKYCNTIFYPQNYSSNLFDCRKENYFKETSFLHLPFPIGKVNSISEDDVSLLSTEYHQPKNHVATLRRLNSEGWPIDWGQKIIINGWFGYALPDGCNSQNLPLLPHGLRLQAAVMCAWLLGYRSSKDVQKKEGWENRTALSLPIATLGGGNTFESFLAVVPNPASNTQPVKTYTGNFDLLAVDERTPTVPITSINDRDISLGYQAPISETLTKTVDFYTIPAFEYKKLDPYRFLEV
jgi:hypothetical protein